jgi:hypothetical protein
MTSITEFELRQAIQCNKPVLVFLLDAEAEWPSSQFDAVTGEGDQGKAVAALRQELGQQYLVSYFKSPEDLASLASAAVYRLEMSHQMDLESLNVQSRLNEPMFRHGPVTDSTLGEIKNIIAGPDEVQALQIDIGSGLDWWITRLYFLSSLAADLTEIEVMVFVTEGGHFVGVANPRVVKEQLAASYPQIKQYEDALAASGQPVPDLSREVERRAGVWRGQMDSLGGEHLAPSFVTRRSLYRLLSPYIITQGVELDSNENAALQMQRLLDWPMRFIPVLAEKKFVRIVDQRALAEQVARLFVREQVSRTLSMAR